MTKLKINKSENGLNQLAMNYLILFLFTLFLLGCNSHGHKSPKQSNKRAQSVVGNPAENLPSHIRRLTHFGQRGNWSHDGKKILFLERTYGDVYELTLETGVIQPVTHHFYHEGFVRANYLTMAIFCCLEHETLTQRIREAVAGRRPNSGSWIKVSKSPLSPWEQSAPKEQLSLVSGSTSLGPLTMETIRTAFLREQHRSGRPT